MQHFQKGNIYFKTFLFMNIYAGPFNRKFILMITRNVYKNRIIYGMQLWKMIFYIYFHLN